MSELVAPFKPFTESEVAAITQAESRWIDRWRMWLPLHHGCGISGMDDIQTFACFVAWRYMKEGSTVARAEAVLRYVAVMGWDGVHKAILDGNTFPVPADMADGIPRPGIMVKAPKGRIGSILALDVLWDEFKARLEAVFPKIVQG